MNGSADDHNSADEDREGSKSEAGVELGKLPEFQHPFTFKSEHGLPTLRHCSVEMFPEDY